jgi:hypothetical protein
MIPIKDFISACRAWGEWTFMDPKYMRPRGILGLEDPELDWDNCIEPWWAPITHFIRHWNVTFQNVGHCLHWRDGWMRWDNDNLWGRVPRWLPAAFYTFKIVICLLFLQWRRPKLPEGRLCHDWSWIDVAAWNLGTCYYGEPTGDLLRTVRGIFRHWYVEKNSV